MTLLHGTPEDRAFRRLAAKWFRRDRSYSRSHYARPPPRGPAKKLRRWIAVSKVQTGIPARTLRRWCATGKVRSMKHGKIWYVYLPEIQRRFRTIVDD